jgi:CubicO group peptidase (beta-lactamase class C family)
LLFTAQGLLAQQPKPGPIPCVPGIWQGILDVGGMRARLGLRIEGDSAGRSSASITNIDAGNLRLPATCAMRGDTVVVSWAGGQATYAAVITTARDSLYGLLKAPGSASPLRMGRVTELTSGAALAYPTRLASDSVIRAILAKRIDQQKRSVGMVVGVIDSGGRRIIAYGRRAKGDDTALDGNSLFEIGSVTKVFTSLVLADMVRRGEVALSDPVAKYLPAGTKVPERAGRQITLLDLATHTSGLPRDPINLAPKDPSNPFADYTTASLYQFLATYTLRRDVGAQYEYSNVGFGLLGEALARRAGTDYESLVRSRVLEPLGMRNTTITLPPNVQARLAVGYDAGLEPAPYFRLPALLGAGGIYSDASDMLTFLAANMGDTSSPLSAAMRDMLATRRPSGTPNLEIALGWHVSTPNGHEIVWHNGGTTGFRSFVGFDRARRVGVVVLSNTSVPEGGDDIGLYLLQGGGPLYDGAVRAEVRVPPNVLDAYVGHYALTPKIMIDVFRGGEHFYVQLTGQQRLEAFASSSRDFFLKAVDAQITFEVDDQGRATALVLHQNGSDRRAKRVE